MNGSPSSRKNSIAAKTNPSKNFHILPPLNLRTKQPVPPLEERFCRQFPPSLYKSQSQDFPSSLGNPSKLLNSRSFYDWRIELGLSRMRSLVLIVHFLSSFRNAEKPNRSTPVEANDSKKYHPSHGFRNGFHFSGRLADGFR